MLQRVKAFSVTYDSRCRDGLRIGEQGFCNPFCVLCWFAGSVAMGELEKERTCV